MSTSDQLKPRDVGEVFSIQSPEGCFALYRMGRDDKIYFAAAWPGESTIEVGSAVGFVRAKRQGFLARKESFLGFQLLG